MFAKPHRWLGLWLGLVGACTEAEPGPLQEHFDVGNACLSAEGTTLVVDVDFGLCVGCSTELATECTVERDGTTLVVHSEARWRRGRGNCDASCMLLMDRCELDDVPAGHYAVEYGTQSFEVDVPVVGDPVCSGSAAGG